MTFLDFYEILESDSTASDDQLHAQYRKLAKKYHPDTQLENSGDDEFMKLVNLAWEVLRDPQSRKGYDNTIAK